VPVLRVKVVKVVLAAAEPRLSGVFRALVRATSVRPAQKMTREPERQKGVLHIIHDGAGALKETPSGKKPAVQGSQTWSRLHEHSSPERKEPIDQGGAVAPNSPGVPVLAPIVAPDWLYILQLVE